MIKGYGNLRKGGKQKSLIFQLPHAFLFENELDEKKLSCNLPVSNTE